MTLETAISNKPVPVIISSPINPFAQEFKGYLQTHFPGLDVKITNSEFPYMLSGEPQYLVFVEKSREEVAAAIGYKGHKVFILEEGLSHSVRDLNAGGLTGVIYRLEGDKFRGFTKDVIGKTADEVLKQYLK